MFLIYIINYLIYLSQVFQKIHIHKYSVVNEHSWQLYPLLRLFKAISNYQIDNDKIIRSPSLTQRSFFKNELSSINYRINKIIFIIGAFSLFIVILYVI